MSIFFRKGEKRGRQAKFLSPPAFFFLPPQANFCPHDLSTLISSLCLFFYSQRNRGKKGKLLFHWSSLGGKRETNLMEFFSCFFACHSGFSLRRLCIIAVPIPFICKWSTIIFPPSLSLLFSFRESIKSDVKGVEHCLDPSLV